MSKSTVELDFFGINKQSAAGKLSPVEHRSSVRGIQNAISRIDPQLLRSVIASGGGAGSFMHAMAPAPVPLDAKRAFLSQPVSRTVTGSPRRMDPLTIFYNGTVTVFDLPHDKAEAIIKLAEAAGGDRAGPGREAGLLEKLDGDVPIARRMSLQRFLEKRKERLTASGPYGGNKGGAVGSAEAGAGATMASNF